MKFFKPLITGPDGFVSHTKLWSNIANLAATVAFVYHNFTHEPSVELFLAYMGCVSGSAAVSKAMTLRYRGPTPAKEPQ